MAEPSRMPPLRFDGALFLLFLGLRLAHQIDWSWEWVAAPLWVPCLFSFGAWLKKEIGS